MDAVAMIEALREEIDTVDQQMIDLLVRRREIVSQIAAHKRDAGMSVEQTGRKQAMYEQRIAYGVSHDLDPAYISEMWELIHKRSVLMQQRQNDTAKSPSGDMENADLCDESDGAEHRLFANENPLGCSPAAIRAITGHLETLHRYPPASDESVRQLLSHRYDLSIDSFVLTNSGCDLLNLISRAWLDSQSSIVIAKPTFFIYETTAQQAGATIINAGRDPATFGICPDAIAAAIRDDTAIVYLSNPNNPTGVAFGQDVFDQLLDVIPEDVLIVYDDVYHQFATAIDLPDVCAAIRAGRNIIAVRTFSKCHGMAGLRVGYGIAPPPVIAMIDKQKNPFHINALGLVAAQAALSDTAHVQRTVDHVVAERARVIDTLRSLGVHCIDSYTNFVLVQCPDGQTPESMLALLAASHVIANHAYHLDDYIRVSIGTTDANTAFVEAMTRLMSA